MASQHINLHLVDESNRQIAQNSQSFMSPNNTTINSCGILNKTENNVCLAIGAAASHSILIDSCQGTAKNFDQYLLQGSSTNAFFEDHSLALTSSMSCTMPVSRASHDFDTKKRSRSQQLELGGEDIMDSIVKDVEDNDYANKKSILIPPNQASDSNKIDFVNQQAQPHRIGNFFQPCSKKARIGVETHSMDSAPPERRMLLSRADMSTNYFSTTTTTQDKACHNFKGQPEKRRVTYDAKGERIARSDQDFQHGLGQNARHSKSTRSPHFSPIHERRTEEQKKQAREKTIQRKNQLKQRREHNQAQHLVFGEMIDSQTAVLVFQTYYVACMQEQAQRVTVKRVLRRTVTEMTNSIANECLQQELNRRQEATNIVTSILDLLVCEAVEKSETQKLLESVEREEETKRFTELPSSFISASAGHSFQQLSQSPKEEISPGLGITSARSTPKQICLESSSEENHLMKKQPQKLEQQKSLVRDSLADKMCEFACDSTEEKIINDLISHSIQEHLLIEFTFEAVLKSLLGESNKTQQPKTQEIQNNDPPRIQQPKPQQQIPNKATQSQQQMPDNDRPKVSSTAVKQLDSKIPKLSPRPDSLRSRDNSQEKSYHKLTQISPMSRLRLPTTFQGAPTGRGHLAENVKIGIKMQMSAGSALVKKGQIFESKSAVSVKSQESTHHACNIQLPSSRERSLTPLTQSESYPRKISTRTEANNKGCGLCQIEAGRNSSQSKHLQYFNSTKTMPISKESPAKSKCRLSSANSQKSAQLKKATQRFAPLQQPKETLPLFKSIPLKEVAEHKGRPEIFSARSNQSKNSQNTNHKRPPLTSSFEIKRHLQRQDQNLQQRLSSLSSQRRNTTSNQLKNELSMRQAAQRAQITNKTSLKQQHETEDLSQLEEAQSSRERTIHILSVRKAPSQTTNNNHPQSMLYLQPSLLTTPQEPQTPKLLQHCKRTKVDTAKPHSNQSSFLMQAHQAQKIPTHSQASKPQFQRHLKSKCEKNNNFIGIAPKPSANATFDDSVPKTQKVPAQPQKKDSLFAQPDESENSASNITNNSSHKQIYSTRVSQQRAKQQTKQTGDQSNQQTRSILKLLKRHHPAATKVSPSPPPVDKSTRIPPQTSSVNCANASALAQKRAQRISSVTSNVSAASNIDKSKDGLRDKISSSKPHQQKKMGRKLRDYAVALKPTTTNNDQTIMKSTKLSTKKQHSGPSPRIQHKRNKRSHRSSLDKTSMETASQDKNHRLVASKLRTPTLYQQQAEVSSACNLTQVVSSFRDTPSRGFGNRFSKKSSVCVNKGVRTAARETDDQKNLDTECAELLSLPSSLCVVSNERRHTGYHQVDENNEQMAAELLDELIKGQVKNLAGRYIQSVLCDHFYRRTLKKVIRMMLFQVIQECVDLVYFLEEDTISTANNLLDNFISAQISGFLSDHKYFSQQVVLNRDFQQPVRLYHQQQRGIEGSGDKNHSQATATAGNSEAKSFSVGVRSGSGSTQVFGQRMGQPLRGPTSQLHNNDKMGMTPAAFIDNIDDDDKNGGDGKEEEDEEDQMQMIRDDEDCIDKHCNIQKSITNSYYNSPKMNRKGNFQADVQTGFTPQSPSTVQEQTVTHPIFSIPKFIFHR